jgi:predicted transcriptional regulator
MGRLDRSRHRDIEIALRHPLRRQLLDLGPAVAGEPLDLAELSALTGEPPGRVRYHLRVLAACGLAPGQRAGESLGDRAT